MRSIDFFGWNIEVNVEFNDYLDIGNRRLVFLNDSTKEIMVVFEINQENELIIHPRVVQQVIFKDERT